MPRSKKTQITETEKGFAELVIQEVNEYLEREGITKKALAEKCNILQGNFGQMLLGNRPINFETGQRILDAIGIEIEYTAKKK